MLWMILSLTSAASTAAKGLTIRKVSVHLDVFTIIQCQYIVSALLSAGMLLITGIPELSPGFFLFISVATVIDFSAALLYTKAISSSELAKSFPLVAFTPIFIIGTSFIFLREVPSLTGLMGILAIVLGAYVLRAEDLKKNLLTPFKLIIREKGPRYMLLTSFLFSLVSPFFKRAIFSSSPYFAMGVTHILSLVLMLLVSIPLRRLGSIPRTLKSHPWGFLIIGLMTFVTAVSYFLALDLTLAVYVVSVKRMSIPFAIILGFLFFREKNIVRHLTAGLIMVAGILLIAIG